MFRKFDTEIESAYGTKILTVQDMCQNRTYSSFGATECSEKKTQFVLREVTFLFYNSLLTAYQSEAVMTIGLLTDV